MKNILKNKVLIYLFSRYFTYLIQFIVTILIAVKLGPYNFGIWGFLLLLINGFQIFNFGISNAINILMIQNKENTEHVKNFVATSFLLIGIVCFASALLVIYNHIYGIPLLKKYEVNNMFVFVGIIVIISYINRLMMTIYRVKNGLLEVAFFQSIIQILVLFAIVFINNEKTIITLLSAYLLGHILSFLIFYKGKRLPKNGKANFDDASLIIRKGLVLFAYNIFFYLIIVSTRVSISAFYKVEEYGLFAFSFTLANSLLLLLNAVGFLIFPKVIDKLNSNHPPEKIKLTIKMLRINYVSFSHGLVYASLAVIPIFLTYIPQYKDTTFTVSLIALSLVLYSNSFGYNAYLMAQNKEKIIALISLFGLFINLTIILTLIFIFHVNYELVIISTMISYFIYSYLCVHYGMKHLYKKLNFSKVFVHFFPINLLIPYALSIFLIVIHSQFMFIPIIAFSILNVRTIKQVLINIKKIINNPKVADI